MQAETFIIPLFYVVTIGGAVLAALATTWSSARLRSRVGRAIVFTFLALVTLEVCSLVALRVNYGSWLYGEKVNHNAWIFKDHPYLIAMPVGDKSYSVKNVTITHNSLGFRGQEFAPKGNKKRIVAIGGSTTYGVDVSDTETWPHQLERQLGDGYEVLNLGLPGHSTAEHLYTMGAIASRLNPDVVVLHVGHNDMHCMHDAKNTPFLNKCHSDLMVTSSGRCFVSKLPRLAWIRSLVSILQNTGLAPRCPQPSLINGAFADVDPEVMQSYRAQVGSLIAMAKGMGAYVVLVPQVGFRASSMVAGDYGWWTPNLEQKSLGRLLTAFNDELASLAQTHTVSFVSKVSESTWGDPLFIDASHLTGEGNKRLATLIGEELRTATDD